jgi:hypothetical protein
LLIELDGSSAWDVDMAVRSEPCDQGNQDAREERDPALKVEEQNPTHAEPSPLSL